MEKEAEGRERERERGGTTHAESHSNNLKKKLVKIIRKFQDGLNVDMINGKVVLKQYLPTYYANVTYFF